MGPPCEREKAVAPAMPRPSLSLLRPGFIPSNWTLRERGLIAWVRHSALGVLNTVVFCDAGTSAAQLLENLQVCQFGAAAAARERISLG
ncbi:hypothetical protein AAFF_G00056300 [Aldrovandia affinis]|uniref:Uncharacterized protein n=1 Tax=Aldrovandia affinis TaxID=143900 RepID=A0AAD7S0R8_9TELE|nr:hypothetical protein AAFF_G00056300 [Aldrovandia affinis]